jgi:hypothetical protein
MPTPSRPSASQYQYVALQTFEPEAMDHISSKDDYAREDALPSVESKGKVYEEEYSPVGRENLRKTVSRVISSRAELLMSSLISRADEKIAP